MYSFIFDTNFFFNVEAQTDMGRNTREIMQTCTHYAKLLTKNNQAAFYMPPRIVEEIYTFVDRSDAVTKELLSYVSIKSPDIASISFPAPVFYQLIQEVRDRSYRGLQISEELVDQTAKSFIGKADEGRIAYQKSVGEHIVRLRDRYRNATRFNFLDSVADLDLIVLSKQVNGELISTDEGVLRWGRTFGISELAADQVKSRFEALSSSHPQA